MILGLDSAVLHSDEKNHVSLKNSHYRVGGVDLLSLKTPPLTSTVDFQHRRTMQPEKRNACILRPSLPVSKTSRLHKTEASCKQSDW